MPNIKCLSDEEVMEYTVAKSQNHPVKKSMVSYKDVHKLLERCVQLNYSPTDILRLFEWEFNK